MSLRTKFIITNILLLFALVYVARTAKKALEAFRSFQIQNILTKRGNVCMIGPGMTTPYVAHTYHVPKSYLYQSLNLPNSHSLHHTTLQKLSSRPRHPIDSLIYKGKDALLVYRRHRSQPSTMLSPFPNRHDDKKLVVERKNL